MTIENIIQIIYNIIFLFLFIYLWLFAYREYRVDEFRQRIFELRDKMFIYAANQPNLFKQPAYRILRQMMNGTLRFADSLSLWFLFLILFCERLSIIKDITPNISEEWTNELKKIEDNQVKQSLQDYFARFQFELIRYIFIKSLPIFIFLMIFCFITSFIQIYQNFKIKSINRIQTWSGLKTIENQSYLNGGAI